jgi:hypothetical protein
MRLIISRLSIGVLQSSALENNVVWQATMTSKRITQLQHNMDKKVTQPLFLLTTEAAMSLIKGV